MPRYIVNLIQIGRDIDWASQSFFGILYQQEIYFYRK